jgi:hypothetical protein
MKKILFSFLNLRGRHVKLSLKKRSPSVHPRSSALMISINKPTNQQTNKTA